MSICIRGRWKSCCGCLKVIIVVCREGVACFLYPCSNYRYRTQVQTPDGIYGSLFSTARAVTISIELNYWVLKLLIGSSDSSLGKQQLSSCVAMAAFWFLKGYCFCLRKESSLFLLLDSTEFLPRDCRAHNLLKIASSDTSLDKRQSSCVVVVAQRVVVVVEGHSCCLRRDK